MKDREIFALDIGTRKVMGIIARQNEDGLEILDVEVIEHTSRPMLDGQIHNIEEVSRTVKRIKANLESRQNKKLDKVGVAVAGRNLLTYKSRVSKEFDSAEEITPEMVKDLELEAVDKIISGSGRDISQFYCAGYSPVYYELDGNKISNLINHRAKSISAELIVTFLPRLVLDSMFAVLKKSNLEATNVTLEPIAAASAIIPPEIRNLNIVLVDIGAGTSDLALSQEGFVQAYGMVPEAGDEISERISEILLVDFSTAETIKRSLNKKVKVEYEDIWGRKQEIGAKDLLEKLSPRVKKLAEAIAKAGLGLSAGIPQAVVVVGGGGLTPDLIQELSVSFGLGPDKVGLRLPSAIKSVQDTTRGLTGPEAVTPIGIALMTANSQGLRFIEIEVNHKKFRMLDFQQKKDLLGALALSGALNNKRLYPRPGLAIMARVNGDLKIIKGTLGRPARVMRNGRPAVSLSEKLEDGDKLEFVEAADGENASPVIKDLLNPGPLELIFNQEALEVMPPVVMNGREADLDTRVPDRADIRTLTLKISALLKFKGLSLENLSEGQILVNINGNPRILTQRNWTLRLNGKAASLDAELKQNDEIEFSHHRPTSYRIKDVVDMQGNTEKMRINVGGKDIEMLIEPVQIFMNGRRVLENEFLLDGADIRVYYLKERRVLLSEIFRYIDFDPNEALGKRMRILVNDSPAGFTTPLLDGSRVNIIFEDR